MKVKISRVEEYFRRYGWEYMEIDDAEQTIFTGFIARKRKYTLIAMLRDDWLVLTIKDLVPPIQPERQTAAYLAALEANSHTPFARFALIDTNRISLIIDLPAADELDYDLFSMSINLLVYDVDRFYPALYEAATGKPPLKEPEKPTQ